MKKIAFIILIVLVLFGCNEVVDPVVSPNVEPSEEPVYTKETAIAAFNNMMEYYGWDLLEDTVGSMPDNYGGCFVGDNNLLAVHVVAPDEEDISGYKEACGVPVEIIEADYTLQELFEARIMAKEKKLPEHIRVYEVRLSERENRVLFIVPYETQVDEAKEAFADTPCIKVSSKNHDSTRIVDVDYALFVGIGVDLYSHVYFDVDNSNRGRLVNVCEYYIPDYPFGAVDKIKYKVYSTMVPVDGRIYEWKGYDPSVRLLCESKYGLVGIELSSSPERLILAANSGQKVGEFAKIRDKVTGIVLTNYPNEIGRIPEYQMERFLDELMNLQYSEEIYLEYMKQKTVDEYPFRNDYISIELQLDDGTDMSITCLDGFATVFGVVKLTDELVNMMDEATLYSGGGMPVNTLTDGFITYVDYLDPEIDFGNHILWDMYVDVTEGHKLYMAPYFWFEKRVLIDLGPVSSLQRKGNTIYYLNKKGALLSVQNKFEGSEADLMDFIDKNGNDALDPYIEIELIDNGPFSEFRIVDGIFYTLSTDGRLFADGELLTEGVNSFEVDNDAVSYINDQGLWRLVLGGTRLLLVEGEIRDLAPGGSVIFFCMDDGIYSVNTKGLGLKKVSSIQADRIICTFMKMEPVLTVMESRTGALKLLFEEGVVNTLVDSGIVEMGVADQTMYAGSDDEIYRFSIVEYYYSK